VWAIADYRGTTSSSDVWRILRVDDDDGIRFVAEYLYQKVYVLKINHPFLAEKRKWQGEGEISFYNSDERVRFEGEWDVSKMSQSEGLIEVGQVLELENLLDCLENRMQFFAFQGNAFQVIVENPVWGAITGVGIIDERLISWEFRQPKGYEGFEVYEKAKEQDCEEGQEKKDLYFFRAEYMVPDTEKAMNNRTFIHGQLWVAE
jgi:hypothetical protein